MAPPDTTPRKRANKAGKNRSSQTENRPDSVPQRPGSGPSTEPTKGACQVKTPQTHAEGSPAKGEKPKETRRRSSSRKKGSRRSGKGSVPGTPRQPLESPPKSSDKGPQQSSTQATSEQQVSQSPTPARSVLLDSEKTVTSQSVSPSEKESGKAKSIKAKKPVPCKIDSENKKAKMSNNSLNDLCQLLNNIVLQHGNGGSVAPQPAIKPSAPVTKPVPAPSPPKSEAAKTEPDEDGDGEQSREEVERLRKERKEAKKAAKKKGGDQAKSKDGAADESTKEKQNQKEAKTLNKPVGEKVTPLQQLKQGQEGQQQKEGVGTDGKSKADLKRERREKQEAQRQAKAVAKAQQEAERLKKNQSQSQKAGNEEAKKVPQAKKKPNEGKRAKKSAEEDNARRIPLLGHLTPYTSSTPSNPVNCDIIHPAIRTLGQKMKDRVVDGSTARVIATLSALKRFISDYRTPESCDLSRDLAEKMRPNVAHLHACRPLAIAMDNAVRFLKHKINSIEPNVPEAQAKDLLRTAIDEYVKININLASSTIATHASQLLQDGDVILTFGYSALVCDMVEAFNNDGTMSVSVVVADCPYPSSGSDMVKRLAAMGVTTYYRLITDVTHIMHKVTKVVVEAEAVMMNGAVQGVCGTAGLALAAATHDTPFIVLCHTYKFSNNDLTDSLVVNELGDANGIVSCPSRQYCDLLAGWQETDNLNVVSLVYDVTPASLVTVLVTEQSVLPTSSVPVIIRRNYADILGQD